MTTPQTAHGHTPEPSARRPDDDAARGALYLERARLVAALSTHRGVVDAVLSLDPAPLEATCATVVTLSTAEGQMTWHLADADVELFAHLPIVAADDPRARWDGHTTAEKYARLRRFLNRHAASGDDRDAEQAEGRP